MSYFGRLFLGKTNIRWLVSGLKRNFLVFSPLFLIWDKCVCERAFAVLSCLSALPPPPPRSQDVSPQIPFKELRLEFRALLCCTLQHTDKQRDNTCFPQSFFSFKFECFRKLFIFFMHCQGETRRRVNNNGAPEREEEEKPNYCSFFFFLVHAWSGASATYFP